MEGDQFDCGYGDHCIPISWVGDGEFDCIDQSDEQTTGRLKK